MWFVDTKRKRPSSPIPSSKRPKKTVSVGKVLHPPPLKVSSREFISEKHTEYCSAQRRQKAEYEQEIQSLQLQLPQLTARHQYRQRLHLEDTIQHLQQAIAALDVNGT